MTSRRPRPDRPIQFVALKITFRADRKTAAEIKKRFPSVKVHDGRCEVEIEAERPAEIAEKARELLERLGRSPITPKGYK